MSDNYDRLVHFPAERLNQVHQGIAGAVVKVSCRFIGEQKVRFVDQCAGKRHALAFSTGQFSRLMVQSVLKPDLNQKLLGPIARLIFVDLRDQCREHGIFQSRKIT